MSDEGWVAITIRVHEDLSDALANRLLELGSTGIVTEDTKGGEQRLIAHFRRREWQAARPMLDRYVLALGELFPTMPAGDIQIRPVSEEDWAENWKQHFRPTVVSPRLLVYPPWEENADKCGKLPLIIDPGMAFGTGIHATTRLVLCTLDEILQRWQHPGPARVLDVGTGSGILAIAAARLGAGEVVGIDIDPSAVAAARENLARNELMGRILLQRRSVDEVCGMYDLVLANLSLKLLKEKHRFLLKALAPEGYLVASGFLTRDLPEIMECYAGEPVSLVKEESLEEWHMVVWQRLAQPH